MKRTLIALLFAICLPGESLTPAGKAIEVAQARVAKEPDKAEHHCALALAYSRRARETSDTAFYENATATVARALQLSPDSLEALKVKGWILLGQHEFAKALKVATELRRRSADDEMIYGLLTDANAELGNYKEAEDAAQWMLNVGRSSVPGLTRGAFLRELFGDIEGALELMTQAFHRINPSEAEDRAWTLTQIAHLMTLTGKVDDAAQILENAIGLMPDYHYALAGLARVRTAQGRHEEAVRLLQRRYELAPHPENAYDVAAALNKAGRYSDSRAMFAAFEKRAIAESKGWDNANRELIFYYTDYAGRPAEALPVAEREIARRKDVFTLDAYAWALHRNGRSREALRYAEAALAVGTVEPKIVYHAGAIALTAGKPEAAEKYLKSVNERSEVASDAQRLLAQIRASSARSLVVQKR
jgi:tetratricopeptide (TPR) repeat protein